VFTLVVLGGQTPTLRRLIRNRYFDNVASDISMPSSPSPRTICRRVNPRLIASSISGESSEMSRNTGRPCEDSSSFNIESSSAMSSPGTRNGDPIAVSLTGEFPHESSGPRRQINPRLRRSTTLIQFSSVGLGAQRACRVGSYVLAPATYPIGWVC